MATKNPKKMTYEEKLRYASWRIELFASALRTELELHTNDVPDVLESVATKWWIQICKSHYIFKQHDIQGYEDAIPVYSKPIEKREDTTSPLNISSGLFRSMR
jgi:hypothetical protein